MFKKEGEEELETSEDSDVEMSDVDVVDGEGGSEVEEASDNESTDAAKSENSEESSSDEDSSEDVVDEDEVAAFENKLAQALGTHRGEEDLNASDDSGSDEAMDDEQMEALDDHLIKMFKERKKEPNKKKDQKNAKETMVNFKVRVLELVEIYVKQEYSKILALDLLMPLLQLIRTTNTKHLADKAVGILRDYSKSCKGKEVPTIEDSEPLFALLKSVHDDAVKGGSLTHNNACNQASLILVKTLVAHDKKAINEVVDIYASTRKRQLTDPNCKVLPAFFTEWSNWCVSASQQLRG